MNSDFNVSSCIYIRDQLYCIKSSSQGVTVSSSSPNSEFCEIKTSGVIPPSRSGFCITDLSTSKIAMIGGTGADQPEVYLLDMIRNEWAKICIISTELGARVNSRAVCFKSDEERNEYELYLFGGCCSGFCENNLLMFKLKNKLGSCAIVNCKDDVPCGRHSHSMANDSGKIYVFGGLNEMGQVLGDLWELDLKSSPLSPFWKKISDDPSIARHSHSSFCQDGYLYIIGGFGSNDEQLNDVCRFSSKTGWEKVNVFNSDNLAYGCKEGFFDISNKLLPLKLYSPLSLLDNKIKFIYDYQVKMNQILHTKEIEANHLQQDIHLLQNLKKEIQKDGIKSNNIISKETENKLLNEIVDLRKQFLSLSNEVIQINEKNCIVSEIPISLLENHYNKLKIDISRKTEKYERRKRELKFEKETYLKQKEIVDSLKSDTGIVENDSNYEMNMKYVQKSRELEKLHHEIEKANKKLKSASQKSYEDDNYMIELIYLLSESNNKLNKSLKKEESYKSRVERLSIQTYKIKECLKVWKQDPNEPPFEEKVKKLQLSLNELQNQIFNDIKEYAKSRKQTVQAINQHLDLFKNFLETNNNIIEGKNKIQEISKFLKELVNSL